MNDITLLRTDSLNTDRVTDEALAAARELLMAEIAGERTTSMRHRSARWPLRRMAAVAAVAAVAAAATAIPAVLPTHSPGAPASAAAATLQRLAGMASSIPAAAFGPGQFLHQTQTTSAPGRPVAGGCVGPTAGGSGPSSADCARATLAPESVVDETWTDYQGNVWQRETVADRVTVTLMQLTRYPPRVLAALPTDVAALRRYIEAHPLGKAGTIAAADTAMNAAVIDILRGNLAPAAVRAAAFRLLQDSNQHITLGPATRDPLGRLGVELIIDPVKTGGGFTSIIFDPATSQVLSEQLRATAAGGAYSTQTYSATDVVDVVPADVVSSAGR